MTAPTFLSILIPVYNWDISELLTRLDMQVTGLPENISVEIIVADDASAATFKNRATAEDIESVSYSVLPENIGRAAIRNLLFQKAVGSYVLFLDADMLPDRDDFLQQYIRAVKKGKEIVCGGISYQQCPEQKADYSFYLYKSRRTEALPASLRKKSPWRYLFTSNILLSREHVIAVPFDSEFSGYGFEDIEWGLRLEKRFTISHIDNSCSHMGLLRKSAVYENMTDSIVNYRLLLSLHPESQKKTGAGRFAARLQLFPVPLLKTADKLLAFLFRHLHWNWLLFNIFQLNKACLLALSAASGHSSDKVVEL